MQLVFDANISQQFWRYVYPASSKLGTAPQILAEATECAYNAADVRQLSPSWLNEQFLGLCGGKTTALVFDPRNRRSSKEHEMRLWSHPVPEGSFFDLKNGALVSSPEFTFLQLANTLDLAELIAYGDELCGYYAFNRLDERGLKTRVFPLTTLAKLGEYVRSARGCRGRERAMRALQFIVERSASPMESNVEMLLCLPYRYGGYGLPKPFMNYEVKLDPSMQRIAKRTRCYADICYPDIPLGIEYQGRFAHLGEESFDSDRARINALKASGYDVIELTWGQVSDPAAFEEIACYIADRLGKRFHPYALGPREERRVLRETIFTWSKLYGRAPNQQ